jgi:glucose-6-phosphate isomerase
MSAQKLGQRLFAKDPALWKTDAPSIKAIANRLGWLDSVKDFLLKAGDISQFAREIRDAKLTHVVLLGMGGSSLCPEVARETFGDQPGWPKLLMLDDTNPAAVLAIEAQIQLESTLFLVASKSGTTTETTSFYRYFYRRLSDRGIDAAGSHFVAITDPGTMLVEEARQRGFRRVFENPPDIGGRYSALSYFGLLPMALMGIDIRLILDEALRMHQSCGPDIPPASNPAASLGTWLGLHEKLGRNKVTFVLSPSIRGFGAWAEQLVAESTGKEGRGLIPVDGEDPGKLEAYGQDRIFVSMALENETDSQTAAALSALETQGHPLARIILPSKQSLGAEFLRWEIATAIAGAVMGVNPFDEPNVAESKRNTAELLQEWKKSGGFPEIRPMLEREPLKVYFDPKAAWAGHLNGDSLPDLLKGFMDLAQPGDYLALLAYFQPGESRLRMLQELRRSVRDRARIATTLGYGPRYLHSTGQLHKGGPDRGIFILFTGDPCGDLQIPGEEYGFSILQQAQALGDFNSLASRGRRIIRVHLGPDIDKGLRTLLDSLSPK